MRVGGEHCPSLSAELDNTYQPSSCHVTSCTSELQTRIILQCRLPHLGSFKAHAISVDVVSKGASPVLATAIVSYSPVLRSFSPDGGSVAGGQILHLYGDGLSTRIGDISVQVGGVRCLVIATNASQVSCVTGPLADPSTTTTAAVELQVRGEAASCSASPCTYTYDTGRTSILTSASVTSKGPSSWTLQISATNLLTPVGRNTISVGGTPCTSIQGSGTQVSCTTDPPLAGHQVVALTNGWGSARGTPSLPTIQGVTLSVGTISPTTTSLAGGTELEISGAGFSATSSRVDVCDKPCEVTSVAATALRCRVPSRLVHYASGLHYVNVTSQMEAEYELGFSSPPPPPPGVGALPTAPNTLTLRGGKDFAMSFDALSDATMPRGADLVKATLHVIPQTGGSGAVVVDMRAALYCGDATPLLASHITASTLVEYPQNATVEWDIQPYGLGFASDESPDLAPLLREAFTAASSLDSCSVVLMLTPRPESVGFRAFYAAASLTRAPELRIAYDPPTSAKQATLHADVADCPVTVAVPAALAPSTDGCNGLSMEDGAASQSAGDTNECPHLHLEAVAARSGLDPQSCRLSINGVEWVIEDQTRDCASPSLACADHPLCARLCACQSVARLRSQFARRWPRWRVCCGGQFSVSAACGVF